MRTGQRRKPKPSQVLKQVPLRSAKASTKTGDVERKKKEIVKQRFEVLTQLFLFVEDRKLQARVSTKKFTSRRYSDDASTDNHNVVLLLCSVGEKGITFY